MAFRGFLNTRAAATFAFTVFCAMLLSACGGGNGGSTPTPPPTVTLQTITVTPGDTAAEPGILRQFSAIGSYSDGSTKDLSRSALWSSSDLSIAAVDSTGTVTAKVPGTTSIQASESSIVGSTSLTVISPPHSYLKDAGIYVQFERRGWPSEFWSGQVIQNWDQFDSVVGSKVSDEVSLQLDKMKEMGVNTITFELRAAQAASTGAFVPPDCPIDPVLGLRFPQPTATELTNLPLFFDMVQSKGMKLWLILTDTHMEEQPPSNSQTWLGAILGTIGNHPALDLVLFGGSTHLNLDGTCGIPAEAPLWLGPASVPASYVQMAIGLGLSRGIPARKLSAEVVIGNYFIESQPPGGSDTTNGHLWSPVTVEKMIFDNLGIAQDQRTYALSLYERRKCTDAQTLPCTDLDPHDWADQTLQYNLGVIGTGARVVAVEMGDSDPVDPLDWNTQHAVESMVSLFHKYAIDGGTFWHWINNSNDNDSDPTIADPVKRRGLSFTYNPVQKEIVDLAGTHLTLVPNGSFEDSAGGNGVPGSWIATGSGTVSRYQLTQEPGQPEVPSRGTFATRIVNGNDPNDVTAATTPMIAVVPFALLTTTANMRFAWTGDPNPSGSMRPQVFISVLYFQASGTPSAIRAQDTFSYFQEDHTVGFATFPVQYITPADCALVELQFGAARNGLPSGITLDVDNVR